MSAGVSSQHPHGSPDSLLPQLKGAPISVLLALAAEGGREQSCKQLAESTGWWHGTVREALERLQELDLVQRTGFRAWTLCEGVDVGALLQLGPPVLDGVTQEDLDELATTFHEMWTQLSLHDDAQASVKAEGQTWEEVLDEIRVDLMSWLDEVDEFLPWPEDLTGAQWIALLSGEPAALPGGQAAAPSSGQPAALPSGQPAATQPEPQVRSDRSSPPELRPDQPSTPPSNPRPDRTLPHNMGLGHTLGRVRLEQTFGASGFDRPGDATAVMRPERTLRPEMGSERMSGAGGVVVGVDPSKQQDLKQKDQQQTTTTHTLLDKLRGLNPPFSDAEAWLKTAPVQLVVAWLRYLNGLDAESRRGIRNESGFLRAKVDTGEIPPAPQTGAGRTQRQPCPRCGKAVFDRDGRCLVCAGVVTV